MTNIKDIKERIIKAGHEAVNQLIKVAEEEIIKPDPEDELAADRLKSAAATKKLAIFDAFEILNRIENEKNMLENPEEEKNKLTGGFAERRSK
jgi:DNA-binding ferritin-like protein